MVVLKSERGLGSAEAAGGFGVGSDVLVAGLVFVGLVLMVGP